MLGCLQDKLSEPRLSSETGNFLLLVKRGGPSWAGGDPAVVSEVSWKPDSSSRVTLEGALLLKILPEPPVIFLPLVGFKATSSVDPELE